MDTKQNLSKLENTFLFNWEALGGPLLNREFAFDGKRRWRFDFAHLPTKTAIEIEGGQWTGGRHTRGAGYAADCEKYNAAALAGWRVFRFTQSMLKRPTLHLTPIIKFLETELQNSQNRNDQSCPAPAVNSVILSSPSA